MSIKNKQIHTQRNGYFFYANSIWPSKKNYTQMKNILLYSIFLVFMTSTQAQLGKYSFDGTVNAIVTSNPNRPTEQQWTDKKMTYKPTLQQKQKSCNATHKPTQLQHICFCPNAQLHLPTIWQIDYKPNQLIKTDAK